jgi:hypothetical protein
MNSSYFFQVSRNWAAHDSPLDTPLKCAIDGDIRRVSAGKSPALVVRCKLFVSKLVSLFVYLFVGLVTLLSPAEGV